MNILEAILNFDLSVFKFVQDFFGYGTGGFLDKFMPVFTWLGDGAFFIILGVVLCIFKKTRKIGVAMLFAQLVMLFANNIILKSIFSRTRPFALFNPVVAEKCVNGYTRNGEFLEGWMKEGYLTQVLEEMKTYSVQLQQKWLSTYKYVIDVYPYAHGYSFPSGHTSSSFAAACGMLFMCKGKKQNIWGVITVIVAALIGFSRIYLHVHYCTDVLVGAVVGVLCGVAGYFICKALYPYIERLLSRKRTTSAETAEKAEEAVEAVEEVAEAVEEAAEEVPESI